MDTTAGSGIVLPESRYVPSIIHRIPVDIFREVLSTLRDDREAISACNLVSHTWRDVSAPSLFSTVVFRSKSDHPFISLLDFIATHPHLFLQTQSLTLAGKYQEHDGDLEGHQPRTRIVYAILDCDILSSILSRVPALTTLILRHISFNKLSMRYETPSTAVKALSIAHFGDVGGGGWLATLGHLLCVVTPGTLQLPSVSSTVPGELLARANVPRSADIHRFELMGSESLDLNDTLSYFAFLLSPTSLRHLVLQCSATYSIPQLRTLVEAAGRRLETISLGLRQLLAGSAGLNAPWKALGETLSLPAGLRSLCLVWRPAEGSHEIVIPPPIFPDILSRSPSTLSDISISLGVAGNADAIYHASDLQSLEQPWFRQRFAQLQLLLIEVVGMSSDTPHLPELPELLQSGLLRLQAVRSEKFRVLEWRHKLQKPFLDTRDIPQDKDLPVFDQVFSEVESYSSMTPELLKFSKIAILMRHIRALGGSQVPGDQEFGFRQRADALCRAWTRIAEDARA